MAQVPIVEDNYIGDGVNRVFGITWPYLSPVEVFVSVDGINVGFAWLSGSASNVQTNTAPPSGSVVRVYRNTRAVAPLHKFEGGVPFLPRYIDENNEQLLYAVQEGYVFAEAANTNANAALLAAEAAVTTSTAAVTTANTANAKADAAVSTANAAATDAAEALSTANGVDAKANTALSQSTEALALANEAIDAVEAAGVASFNGRSGVVLPQAGDYTASQIDTTTPGLSVAGALDLKVGLTPLASAVGAAMVGFRQAGTGAVTRTVQEKMRESVSVKDYGALGDGVTDDTVAIQAAADAVGYGGGLLFPHGTYPVSAPINLRGAAGLFGVGVEASVIYRTGDYGDTFVCGTVDNSEPARSFTAHGIRFQHSTPYSSGGTSISNKTTTGAHIRLRGAQEAVISKCWFWRLPYGVLSEGGSWVKVLNCQFQGVNDPDTPELQEGVAQLVARYSAVHGNPTTWVVTGNNFLGATRVRDVVYPASSGDRVINRVDTIGPTWGFYIDGLEDADISGNYFGGQSVAEIGVVNSLAGSVIDLRMTRNFFDGISRGQGILFAPTLANKLSLAVSIEGNIFTDNKHAVFVNANPTSATPSVYNLTVRGNICLSGIGTQIRLEGARGFVCDGNSVSDYNKHHITATDATYTGGIVAGPGSSGGLITGNTVGGGGNTLLNDTLTNFCYVGVSVSSAAINVIERYNLSNGIRSGINFRTGVAVDGNQVTLTTGNYQITSADSVVMVNKTANESTAMALPLYPIEGREVTVKDVKGNATAFTTTITTNDGTSIDNASTYVIAVNYGFVKFRFNGTGWSRIG